MPDARAELSDAPNPTIVAHFLRYGLSWLRRSLHGQVEVDSPTGDLGPEGDDAEALRLLALEMERTSRDIWDALGARSSDAD